MATLNDNKTGNPYEDYLNEGYQKLVDKYGEEKAEELQDSWEADDNDKEGRTAYMYKMKDDLVKIYNKMQSGEPLDQDEQYLAQWYINDFDKSTATDLKDEVSTVTSQPQIVVTQPQQPNPVVTQPQQQQAIVKPVTQNTYLYDYGNMSIADAYKEGKHTPREIMLDRYKWGEENGKPMNWIEASYFQNANLDKTKVDAEKEEKRKQWQDAFEHMGHGLITLGNFVGSITGAPAPTTNTVDPIALTERQRKIREATRAQREAYNKDFFANYWKERAEERQRERDKALQNYREQQAATAQQRAEAYSETTHQRADAYASGIENQNKNRDINTQSQVQRRSVQNMVSQQQANNGTMNAQSNRIRANKAKDNSGNNGSGQSKGTGYGKQDKGKGY